jgi:multicomponent Na+:H+ antiporter subunit E
VIRTAGYVGFLLVVWLLLWGEVSAANVVSGLLVAALLLVVFPRPRSTTGFVIRPIPTVRFLALFAHDLVVSNLVLSREVVSRRSRMQTGVIAVPIHGCSESLLAVIANLLALSPGTMTVDITTQPSVLYVHVLIFRDLESVRAKIARLNRLVVEAFASRDDCAAFQEMIER